MGLSQSIACHVNELVCRREESMAYIRRAFCEKFICGLDRLRTETLWRSYVHTQYASTTLNFYVWFRQCGLRRGAEFRVLI